MRQKTITQNDDVGFFGCLGLIMSIPLLFVVGTAANGWALATLWEWFILPVFESAPALGVVQAAGIAMVVSFLTYQRQESKLNDDSAGVAMLKAYWYVLSRPLMSVGFGWALVQFL
jgi:hypothetical protein